MAPILHQHGAVPTQWEAGRSLPPNREPRQQHRSVGFWLSSGADVSGGARISLLLSRERTHTSVLVAQEKEIKKMCTFVEGGEPRLFVE